MRDIDMVTKWKTQEKLSKGKAIRRETFPK